MGIEQSPLLLELDSWGAGIGGTASIKFSVREDGLFTKEIGSSRITGEIKDEENGAIVVSEGHTTMYQGKLSEVKLDALKKFLSENVKEEKSYMIFDAGYTVKYHMDGKVITVKNDTKLYDQITSLVPYDVKKEE
jgi:hypothetical protein